MPDVDKHSVVKSRKSRTGLPQTSLTDALEYVKKAYDTYRGSSFSFDDMCSVMDIKKPFGQRASGEFIKYGLLAKSSDGSWFVTDIGKRASSGDGNAILEIIQTIQIFSELYSKFKEKDVTRGVIENYLKKKKVNVALVASRYIDTMAYVKSLKSQNQINSGVITIEKLIQLKFALNPPSEKDIKSLIEDVYEELKNYPDSAVKTLVESMKENKDDIEKVNLLFKNILSILNEKYPHLAEYKNRKSES